MAQFRPGFRPQYRGGGSGGGQRRSANGPRPQAFIPHIPFDFAMSPDCFPMAVDAEMEIRRDQNIEGLTQKKGSCDLDMALRDIVSHDMTTRDNVNEVESREVDP